MLHLVRHGRTTANAEGRLLGRLDPSLDDEGEAQAHAVAELLATRLGGPGRDAGRTVAVVSSPLGRTRQTAACIAGALGAPVEVDDRWVELDYGELDGVRLADTPASLWADWQADPSFRPPGGESLTDVDERVARALVDLTARLHPEGGRSADVTDVVVVSHVSPIKAAVAWVLGYPGELAWKLFLAPGTVSTATLTPARPVLQSFNERPLRHRPL